MKKFTFLLSILLIACVLYAQDNYKLRSNFSLQKEKISKITQKAALISNLNEMKSLKSESFLKNAAAKQKLDSTVNRVLNADTQVWQNDSKDEYIYNSELKNTVSISKEWDDSAQNWDLWSKNELGYDNKGKLSSMLMSMSIETGQAPTQTSKFVNFYNSQGILDSTLSYSTENAGVNWILDLKQKNYYNASKQLIKVDVWSLDKDLGTFILSMKVVYTYTESGKIKTSSSSYIMEGQEMLWSKTEYNYDTSGKLTSIEDSDLNLTTFVLEKSYRTTYQYNASNDVSVEIISKWNGTSWIEEDKDENTYSTTNFSDIIFPSLIFLFSGNEPGLSMNKQITGVNSFENKNGSWLNTGKTLFYYSAATFTNIVEFGNTLFTVYPNPASEYINFKWKGNYESLSLEMYLITGAKVMEQITYPGKPVSISKLVNGMYFFRLLNDKQLLYSGKVIKD